VKLTQIYQPIEKELEAVESALGTAFSESEHPSILELGEFTVKSPGKRIRPTLVILSARVAARKRAEEFEFEQLVKVATAVELIHIASLVHDDVIDRQVCVTTDLQLTLSGGMTFLLSSAIMFTPRL